MARSSRRARASVDPGDFWRASLISKTRARDSFWISSARQRVGGAVALGGVLAEALHHDVVQVSAQQAAHLVRGGGAGRSGLGLDDAFHRLERRKSTELVRVPAG
jgi:hypothetical protein